MVLWKLKGVSSPHFGEAEKRDNVGVIVKCTLCLSVITMMGITTSIVLTLMQNFECKASIEDTSGGGDIQDFSDDSLRTLQGPFEPILPGALSAI
mmetsp:Transcript_1747/g.3223  ORF Transcript_1747/g.3223 Transcript_1747/m.3223 type:complete len:95 (-) Transcript_1747:1503-1787(-)